MKFLLFFITAFLCFVIPAFAQDSTQTDTAQRTDYGMRIYDNGCHCLPPSFFNRTEDGHFLLPKSNPNAKYYNDPKHWYWKKVSDEYPEFGGYWEVKPEYIDSIQWDDGTWYKAAFWTIERWKREEQQRKENPDPPPHLFIPKDYPFYTPEQEKDVL